MLNDIPVSSSLLSRVAYDEETRDLLVTFKKGATYRYRNVSQDDVDALASAASPGSYFIANIRDQYATSRA